MAAGVGVIAGGGALPRLLAEALAAAGSPYLVCAFEGAAPDWLAAHPHVVTAFEKPGRLFAALRDAGVGRVVLAGAMHRPALRPFAFDLTAARLAPRLLPLLKQGDDALLRGIGSVLEGEGFQLAAAHHLLPQLLAPKGDFAARRADAEDRADIARAAALARALGALDVGQGAVVAGGLCLGLETLQGTDAMLDFVAATPARLRRRPGVLWKGPKPGQDLRMDLPAIGPATVGRAAAAGLGGVAMQAGATLVLDRAATRAEADRLGLFLFGATA